ncbi:hypothetical protein FF011L_20580 [Roseimaritima multifibrata]|uniref:Uncharacterized protein n=1 Tax=Roseimaritima multifibrata TaxID=1930274 RepID=A0A517MEN0_9BACT|nr:hypothetical protein FF011L_20580 [Roseimaritima multifibrata]
MQVASVSEPKAAAHSQHVHQNQYAAKHLLLYAHQNQFAVHLHQHPLFAVLQLQSFAANQLQHLAANQFAAKLLASVADCSQNLKLAKQLANAVHLHQFAATNYGLRISILYQKRRKRA